MTGMEIVELDWRIRIGGMRLADCFACLLYTSDAADEL